MLKPSLDILVVSMRKKRFLRWKWLIAANCVVLGVAEGNMARLLLILIAKRVMLKKFNQVVCSIAQLAASRRGTPTLRVRSPGPSESSELKIFGF